MKAFYFGPYTTSGHFLFSGGGRKASEEEERALPWRCIDGILQPNCTFTFMRWSTSRREVEGEALLHYRGGWTALCFWDRTVDKRSACNSNYFFEGTFTFSEMVDLAKKYFPDRWAAMKFEVFEATEKKNSLLCPAVAGYAPHVPAIVHRAGGPPAEVLNACSGCGNAIGKWFEGWVTLDSWSESAMREGRRMNE